ncbi:MAG: winged helix-turn-helix domain-containing protein [Acidobacteriaceae bacterium]
MKTEEIFQFGEFHVDPLMRSLRRNETPLALNRRSFEVLLYLVQNPGRLVSKEELLKNVWPDVSVDESSLTQNISALRKALEERANEPIYISTVPGRGYQFIAPVTIVRSLGGKALTGMAGEGEVGRTNAFLVQQRSFTTSTVTEERQYQSGLWLGPSRRSVAFLLVIATLSLLGIAGYKMRSRNHPPQTSVTIVLADFLNTTGDVAFDHTLRRALEVDLEQSPYMDVLSERDGVASLQRMALSKDTPLTSDIAREICERTNHQVLLTGTVSSLGKHYLLTLDATDCHSGKSLVSAKTDATSKEHVLEAVDHLADRVRRGLNESKQSLESYAVPIRDATTSSLDALRAYSIGVYLDSQGAKRTEIIAAFQRAVELDPQFAMAYRMLGVENTYVGQNGLSAQYAERAYELSNHVTAREKFAIQVSYDAAARRDVLDSIKTCQLWASTFPQDSTPVADEVDGYMTLGQYSAAVELGERGANLFPDMPIMYENLATIYRNLSRFEDAKAAALKAAKVGKGDTGLHLSFFEIALAQGDKQVLAHETQWFEAHEDGSTVWYYPSFRGDAAAAFGQMKRAEVLFNNAHEAARRANLPEAADAILISQAQAEFRLGLPDAARASLGRVKEMGSASPEFAAAQAEMGDLSFAERFLAAHNSPAPDTIMTYVYLPRIRAAVALRRGRALEAIAALEPATPYEMRDYTVPSLRGVAYQQAGRPDMALKEFQKILNNPGIDPSNILYPLAHLGAARAYASQRDAAASKREYEALFARWTGGDSDLPLLRQAREEYARLN